MSLITSAVVVVINSDVSSLHHQSSSMGLASIVREGSVTELYTRYTVKLNDGRIEYVADYSCDECGWVDNDRSFFYEKNGKLYCSLHKGG